MLKWPCCVLVWSFISIAAPSCAAEPLPGQEQKPAPAPKAAQPPQATSAKGLSEQLAAAFQAPDGSVLLVKTDTGKYYGFITGIVGTRTGTKLVLKAGALVVSLTASNVPKETLLHELWNIDSSRGPYFQSTFPDGSKLTGSVGPLAESETIQVAELLASKPCVPGGYVLPLWRCFAPNP